MMKRFLPEDSRSPLTMIELSPLVGVLLVLLSMIMLGLPQPTNAIQRTAYVGGCAHLDDPPTLIQIGIDAAGTVHLDGLPMSGQQWRYWLRDLRSSVANAQIDLAPSGLAPYASVTELLAAASNLDIPVTIVDYRFDDASR